MRKWGDGEIKLISNKGERMKKGFYFLIGFTCLFLVQASAYVSASNSSIPVGQSGNWTIIFEDNFDGNSLDTTKWIPCYPWGDSSGCGIDMTPNVWYLPENILVVDGKLRIVAKKEDHTINGHTYPYTSGIITTSKYDSDSLPRFTFQNGYMEARVWLPAGQGLWPAFWAYPIDENGPPEIDVMENLGNDPNTVYMGYWYGSNEANQQESEAEYTGPDFSAGWHTFGMSWQPDAIKWYVDGVERRSAYTDSDWIAAEPMYVIANLQVGGDWGGEPDGTTPLPAYYDIDYIRVWTLAAAPTTSTSTSTSSTTTTSTSLATTTTTTTSTTTTTTSTTTSSSTTTTFPICYFSSSRSLVVGDNVIDFQTPHNYPDNMNCFSGIYRCPSGYSARVYVKYVTEQGYDFFTIYNYDSGSSLNSSGNSSGFVWLTPSGFNAVRLRFMSDYSVNAWGVDVDKINCFVGSVTTTTSSTTTTVRPTTTSTTSTIVVSSTSTTRGSTSTTKPPATTTTTSATTSSTGSSSTSTTTSSTTTTGSWPCKMPGDYPPCGEVTIDEILSAITLWVQGKLSLEDVLNLINAWAFNGYYFFQQ